MTCYDVFVNGNRLCRAGDADLTVLSTVLSWSHKSDSTLLTVSGITEGARTEHADWALLRLGPGDVITIRIIDALSPSASN